MKKTIVTVLSLSLLFGCTPKEVTRNIEIDASTLQTLKQIVAEKSAESNNAISENIQQSVKYIESQIIDLKSYVNSTNTRNIEIDASTLQTLKQAVTEQSAISNNTISENIQQSVIDIKSQIIGLNEQINSTSYSIHNLVQTYENLSIKLNTTSDKEKTKKSKEPKILDITIFNHSTSNMTPILKDIISSLEYIPELFYAGGIIKPGINYAIMKSICLIAYKKPLTYIISPLCLYFTTIFIKKRIAPEAAS
jgi:hypothetical protein